MPLLRKSFDVPSGTVCLQWTLDASSGQIWRALTGIEPLQRWLGTLLSGTFNIGSTVEIEHAQDYVCTSRIISCEPGQSLEMTWKFPDEDPSQVSFAIESAAGSQTLTVQHIGLTKEVGEYLTGWQTHLLYLEDFLNGTPRPMSDFWADYERLKNTP